MIAVRKKRDLHIVCGEMSRMKCGHPGNFPVDVVSKNFLEKYSERLLSSLKAHSTSTSGKRVGGCVFRCLRSQVEGE